jgi:hypothetical protein
VISPKQKTLLGNTQHSGQTDIHSPGGFEPSKRPTADPCLRPCGHWDRLKYITRALKRKGLRWRTCTRFDRDEKRDIRSYILRALSLALLTSLCFSTSLSFFLYDFMSNGVGFSVSNSPVFGHSNKKFSLPYFILRKKEGCQIFTYALFKSTRRIDYLMHHLMSTSVHFATRCFLQYSWYKLLFS